MIANIANLKKVLQKCAKAHNCDFEDCSDEGQLLVCSETPATICDVQMILDGFYGNHRAAENSGWGSVTVWLDESMDSGRTIGPTDMRTIRMALPYGTKLN
jgi:hypothetical protein